MAKRLRVEDDFNPVYPYGYARNQNIPFLTPPFVSSDGFQNFPPGVLSLKLADPIAITNGNVSLKVGGGLTVEQQTGNLSVNPAAPLQVASDKLQLVLAPPFEVKDGKLSLKTGNGLKVIDKSITDLPGLIDTLAVLTGKGIGTEELKNENGTNKGVGLRVRLADDGGLTFDEKGDLVAWNVKHDTRTLWTTPDTSPNCTIAQDKDSKLTLVLTKCGSQILANVSLIVVAGKYHIINNKNNPEIKSFTIKLLFDKNGVLLDNSNLGKTYWNFRSGDSNVSTAYEKAIGFMPNLVAYPKPSNSKKYARDIVYGTIYLGGKPDQPAVIKTTFNQETGCEYSITFDFSWSKTYENVEFETTSFTFSYIAQQ
ncbi:fiber [Human adenovirus D10]|uniref:Fiber n=4 Tax=Human adenovirus D10 TaxID=28275 RepID=B5BQ05_9ADEN|nr:fiber [Human adenovirus D10]BAG69148.1 fiber protein [Human adenovirus D10]BAM66662.1 fiber [Human adenovirus D10]BAM66698.1 fiber [Human adenovirus D10]BAM66770.1 fiber [Human adenovirus D10]